MQHPAPLSLKPVYLDRETDPMSVTRRPRSRPPPPLQLPLPLPRRPELDSDGLRVDAAAAKARWGEK